MIRKCSKTKVAIPEGALDLPAGCPASIKNWTPFGIWGLVLYDDQPPWFVLIECMHILFHRHRTNLPLLDPPDSPAPQGTRGGSDPASHHEHVYYSVPRNPVLRHLLFRDPDITNPTQTPDWSAITDRAKTQFAMDPKHLSHLESRFADVGSLQRAIRLLRTTEVEAASSKRWTSRHLLPLGPNMLFADLRLNKKSETADRRFMRRTGEILYLMLRRSKDEARQTLTRRLEKRLLQPRNPWDHLAKLIGSSERPPPAHIGSPDPLPPAHITLKTGYLPFRRLSVYDQLVADWNTLLSLRRIPVENILDPLMRLSALHLIIYILYRAQISTGSSDDKFPPFIFDLAATSNLNPVQGMATDQFDNHIRLPQNAIGDYLDHFAKSDMWTHPTERRTPTDHALKLETRFRWGDPKTSPPHDDATSAELLEDLRTDALKSQHSIWSTIRSLSRAAGMVIARPGIGTWYAPNDDFLEALVLANVRGPTEFVTFLKCLYDRYRIIVGPQQALSEFGDFASFLEPLKENERHLEERLRLLGFLTRKSDACAFVKNPFYQEKP